MIIRCLCCLRRIDKYSTYYRKNGDCLCKQCYEKYELLKTDKLEQFSFRAIL